MAASCKLFSGSESLAHFILKAYAAYKLWERGCHHVGVECHVARGLQVDACAVCDGEEVAVEVWGYEVGRVRRLKELGYRVIVVASYRSLRDLKKMLEHVDEVWSTEAVLRELVDRLVWSLGDRGRAPHTRARKFIAYSLIPL